MLHVSNVFLKWDGMGVDSFFCINNVGKFK